MSGLIYDSFLNHIYKVSFDFKPFKKASLVFSDQNLSHESSECRGQQLQTHGKELWPRALPDHTLGSVRENSNENWNISMYRFLRDFKCRVDIFQPNWVLCVLWNGKD